MAKSFLMIDDDKDDRALFFEALATVDKSISFFYAEDAEEGLNMLMTTAGLAPDLIFLDINLPLMSGWQFLKELKGNKILRNIPVIMYSTSSNQRDIDIAEDLGAFCFITKPNDYKALQQILRILAAGLESENKLPEICREIKNFRAAGPLF